LHPFAVDDKLRDGAFASAGDHLVCGARRGLNIDILEWDVITLQEALGYTAVRAPGGGVDDDFQREFLCVLYAIFLASFAVKPLTAKRTKDSAKFAKKTKPPA
jgi:hypothetical protein